MSRRGFSAAHRALFVEDLRALERRARHAGDFDGASRAQELADAFAAEPLIETRLIIAEQACGRAYGARS